MLGYISLFRTQWTLAPNANIQLFYLRKSAHKIKRGTSLDKKVATEKLNSSQVVPKKKVGPLIHSPQRTKPLAPLTEKNTRERRPRSKTRIGNYHLKVDIFIQSKRCT